MPVLRTNQEKAERLKLFFQKFQNQLQSRGFGKVADNVKRLCEVALMRTIVSAQSCKTSVI